MLKSSPFAFVLSLMLALAHPGSADARPSSSSSSSHSSSSSSSSRSSSSGSFKSGFSSQRSSSSSSSMPAYGASKSSVGPAASGGAGGFGSFGRRPSSDAGSNNAADTAPDAAPSRSSGGFGSFGAGRPAPQKSDSALSQQLGKKAAEANALRTLDARRQAQADGARDTRPVPGYEQGGQNQPAPGYVPPMAPQQQAPVVVRQDSGLGHVVAGAVLANAMRGAHANNGNYPGNYPGTYGNGRGGHGAGAAGGGTSFFGLFMTLCVLALLAWGAFFLWRRLRRARDAKKPNYSFKEN